MRTQSSVRRNPSSAASSAARLKRSRLAAAPNPKTLIATSSCVLLRMPLQTSPKVPFPRHLCTGRRRNPARKAPQVSGRPAEHGATALLAKNGEKSADAATVDSTGDPLLATSGVAPGEGCVASSGWRPTWSLRRPRFIVNQCATLSHLTATCHLRMTVEPVGDKKSTLLLVLHFFSSSPNRRFPSSGTNTSSHC